MFWGNVQRFCYAVRTKHSTFRSAIAVAVIISVSFWTAYVVRVIRTHCQNFWVLCWSVFIIAYAFIDILVASLWERSIYHFWAAQLPVFKEVFIFLSWPDTSNTRVDFSTDGSSRPYRIVTILRDICSFPWLTCFLNFTTRHHVSWVVNSNWRPHSVHMYIGHVSVGQLIQTKLMF